jgi:hypothetical protein
MTFIPQNMASLQDWTLSDLDMPLAELSAALPKATFIDATFPYHRLSFLVPGQTRTLMLDAHGSDQPFLARFRNTRKNMEDTDLAVMVASLKRAGRTPVLFVLQRDAGNVLAQAIKSRLCVLIWLDADQDLTALRQQAQQADMETLHMPDMAGQASPVMLVCPTESKILETLQNASQAKPVSSLARRAITIKPINLLADSAWPAEGDDGYSWLWMGPDVLTRFCLGNPPNDFRHIRVHFMPHKQHTTIATNLAFQLNGKPVNFDGKGLSETGGVVQIVLPPRTAKPLILGIGAFPNAPVNPGDGRHLRACILGVEFSQ